MRQIEMPIACTANFSEYYSYESSHINMYTRDKLNKYTTVDLWKVWSKVSHDKRWVCTRSRYNIAYFYKNIKE